MQRVLVPLDGSPLSDAALEAALEQFPDAEIHGLHVLQIRELPTNDTESAYDMALDDAAGILETAEETAAEHGQELRTETIEGHAARTIVDYAEENDIDHIVMGSTGRSGIKRVLLGSVAETVIRRSPCSVTVIRNE